MKDSGFIKEAIEHIDEILNSDCNEACKQDHRDLKRWLEELLECRKRICKNCKYYEDTTNCRHPYNKQYYYCDGELGMPMSVSKDFGCILFERRERQ